MAALGGAALACALITTLAATPASASAPASPYLEARSSSAPLPTSAEVRQATADFLDSYGSSDGGAGIAGTGGTEPGETEPPPEIQQRWEEARAGGRAAFDAMRPGATGWDVDRAQRSRLEGNGSIPIIWSTGHPVGYWAHDLGPRLGGSANGDRPRGDALRVLREGHTFAFDGFFGWTREDGATKTISVEEMAAVTTDGAEYLIPPQQELVLISSR